MDGLADQLLSHVRLDTELTEARVRACLDAAIIDEALRSATSFGAWQSHAVFGHWNKIGVLQRRIKRLLRTFVNRARTAETRAIHFVPFSALVTSELQKRYPFVDTVEFLPQDQPRGLHIIWSCCDSQDSMTLSAAIVEERGHGFSPQDAHLANTLVRRASEESEENGEPYSVVFDRLFDSARKARDEKVWTEAELEIRRKITEYVAKCYPEESEEDRVVSVLRCEELMAASRLPVDEFLARDYELHIDAVTTWAQETGQLWYQHQLDQQWGI